MIIKTFFSGPCATNTYVVGCSITKKAFVVDVPPGSLSSLLKILQEEGLTLEKILLTHSHWDHIGDVKALQKATGAKVFIHRLDAENLKNPGSDRLPLYFPIEGISADGFLEEGDEVVVGTMSLRVLFTPGHTPGGICFYFPEEKILFSGDTLFKQSMGRVDFPTSNAESMWNSLHKVSNLPEDTKVLSGHGEATFIGKEKWAADAKKKFG